MIELMMILSLSPIANPTLAKGPLEPCMWPLCGGTQISETIEVAEGPNQPCMWPLCGGQRGETPAPILLADEETKPFEICLAPRTCGGKRSDTVLL